MKQHRNRLGVREKCRLILVISYFQIDYLQTGGSCPAGLAHISSSINVFQGRGSRCEVQFTCLSSLHDLLIQRTDVSATKDNVTK